MILEKSEAEELLHEKYGVRKYENKYYENVFTRFFEGYYLPYKFGFETRKMLLQMKFLEIHLQEKWQSKD